MEKISLSKGASPAKDETTADTATSDATHTSPLRILIKIVALIFITEAGIMLILPSHFTSAWIIGSLLLTTIVTPIIYYIIARPLLLHMEEREKREEASRRAQEQAEGASRLKDKFVTLVSHDLRSPLSSIIGLLRILNADSVHPLNEDQKALLEHVMKAGDDLVNMIDKLLNIGKLQAGIIQPHFKFIDAHELTVKCVAQVSHLAILKGINLNNEVPDNIRIYADPDLLGEVIINLLFNAIKFSIRGDTVTVHVPGGRTNIIAVRDTGVGIPQEILPRLRKHYDKTCTVGTEGEEGFGLGLPLCYDIMDAHNGSLSVTSQVGKGSEFFIQTPAVRPLILVVDLDMESRMTLLLQLENLYADTIEAESSEEALAILEETRPHLIVMDANIKMQGSNNSLIEKLKTSDSTKDLPIIAITTDNKTGQGNKKADRSFNKTDLNTELIPMVQKLLNIYNA